MTALYGVHLSCQRVSACSILLLDFNRRASSILCVLDAQRLVMLLLMTLQLLLHMYHTKQREERQKLRLAVFASLLFALCATCAATVGIDYQQARR